MTLPKPKQFSLKWAEQDGRCIYCRLRMINPQHVGKSTKRSGLVATKEHIIPRSKGGRGFSNAVLACNACNHRKGNLELVAFLVIHGAWLYRRRFGDGGGKVWPANDNPRPSREKAIA